MSEPSHTPGPWETGGVITRVVVWPNGWNAPLCIADCHAKNAPKTEAERVANARLIAAAPDLLAALNQVLDASEDNGDMDDIDWDGIRAAIAKAKGTP